MRLNCKHHHSPNPPRRAETVTMDRNNPRAQLLTVEPPPTGMAPREKKTTLRLHFQRKGRETQRSATVTPHPYQRHGEIRRTPPGQRAWRRKRSGMRQNPSTTHMIAIKANRRPNLEYHSQQHVAPESSRTPHIHCICKA